MRKVPKSTQTIYHIGYLGHFKQTLRLNLRSVRALLGREVPHFDALTDTDKKELEYRFSVYCKHGVPDFSQGDGHSIPPTIDNLPNKDALGIALAVNYKPQV